jgi:hypothetical protein
VSPSSLHQKSFLREQFPETLALVALLLALRLRRGATGRRFLAAGLAALGVTGLVAFAAALPYARLVLGHLLTWGLPAALASYLLVRGIGRLMSVGRVPTAAAMLLLPQLLPHQLPLQLLEA